MIRRRCSVGVSPASFSKCRRDGGATILALLLSLLCCTPLIAQYVVDVQVVDLQVSVQDQDHNYVNDLKPEDFLVTEDGTAQEVLDLELEREPFSIGILLDTSSSMHPYFKIAKRGTEDFLWSLRPEDEFFLMTFDDRLLIKKDFGFAHQRSSFKLDDLRYGDSTRMYDAVISAVDRLRNAHYPRRALFIISDGVNTSGGSDLKQAIEIAQQNKVLVYSLLLENPEEEGTPLRNLSEATGGTYFILYDNFPRLQAAYEKIANDLAHRFTIFYRSRSDYTKTRKPEIKVQMKNPKWHVYFQKAYFPQAKIP